MTYDPALLDFLESLVLEQWEGTVWRELLGEADPLRPNERGARWHPPGVAALYGSLSGETAAAEVDYLLSLQPIPISRRRRVKLSVRLTKVVDLRDLSSLTRFRFDPRDFMGRAHDAPRFIGGAISWLGCAGLLVPSVRHAGVNLVIYVDNLGPLDELNPGR